MGEIQLKTYADLRHVAQDIVKSGLTAFETPEQALVLMLQAEADGLHPMKAIQEYHIIHDRRNNKTYPSLRADAMLARFQRAGGRVRWIERSDKAVEAEFHHDSLVEPVRVRWTLEMAQNAGLAGKQNWRQYPRQMLTARVISEGVRIAYPAVATGIYTPEEVQDFDAKPIEVEAEATAASEEPAAPAEAEVVDAEFTEPAQSRPSPNAHITPAGVKSIADALELAGINDKEIGRALVGLIVGREYGRTTDLTVAEGQRVVEYLARLVAAMDQAEVPREVRQAYIAAVVESGELPPTDTETIAKDYQAFAGLDG